MERGERYYRPKERFEVVPKEELMPILDSIKDKDYRMAVIIGWLTGARICEIIAFTKADFMIEGDNITIILRSRKHGKTGYPSFSISDAFITDVLEYIAQLPDGAKLFCRRCTRSYQYALNKANKSLYPTDTNKWVTFHYLRHSRISYLARTLQATPEEIKSWTGHRSSAYEEYFQTRKVERFRGRIA